eukprot:CAMPEP_0173266600 /NCGR_PEP_ID=MMETSP1142-20121109/29255_1 /TAXON_ID=483371 /ORGANISM="non described non described, Strain CCMP2298" /LENGTH=72 /DNA_ID=CAMNT_0014202537 /DNA_START=280 /DNA_END=495 /DNA_ORIENTATION=-
MSAIGHQIFEWAHPQKKHVYLLTEGSAAEKSKSILHCPILPHPFNSFSLPLFGRSPRAQGHQSMRAVPAAAA